MDTNFRLEYIIIIILVVAFYYYTYNDFNNKKRSKRYIKENLKINSKIITQGGIVANVVEIKSNTCLIASGSDDKISYLEISLDSIKNIIEA